MNTPLHIDLDGGPRNGKAKSARSTVARPPPVHKVQIGMDYKLETTRAYIYTHFPSGHRDTKISKCVRAMGRLRARAIHSSAATACSQNEWRNKKVVRN